MTKLDASKGKNISVWIKNKELLAEVQKISSKIQIEPRQFIKNSIEIGVEEMTIFNNIGYIKLALIIKRFKQDVQNSLVNEKADTGFHEKTKPYSIWLKNDTINALEYFQKKLDMKSRSEFIEQLIKMNLRDVRYFEKIGLLQLSVFIRGTWRKSFAEAEETAKNRELKLDSFNNK